MRIFIADPDRLGRLGMQMLLDNQLGMKVVGISIQDEGLIDQARAAQPDAVLIDWVLVEPSPSEQISSLRSLDSQPKIIVFHVRPETRSEAIASGADAFVCKDAPPDDLVTMLRKIKQNESEE